MYDYLCPFFYWGDKIKNEVLEHDHKNARIGMSSDQTSLYR
jgi:hypothetical protein